MVKLGNFNLSVSLKTDEKGKKAADVRMEWYPHVDRTGAEIPSEGPQATNEIIVSGANGFNKINKAWKAFIKDHWPGKE